MSDDLEQTIRDAAAGPLKAAADGVSSEQHPLADLIAADQYLASKAAAANALPLGGIQLCRLRPPGTTAGGCG